MEISKERSGPVLHLRLSGRLDNHWSQPLDDALDEAMREGARNIRLDLSEVTYLSSPAVAVLQKRQREAGALLGSLKISEASERVRGTLRQMALEDLFFGETQTDVARHKTLSIPLPVESERASYESRELQSPHPHSKCAVIGDPSMRTQSRSIGIHRDSYAVGVGALGASHDECRDVFGEFVAAAGCAAFMPTDGTTTPDYMLRTHELIPEMHALHAIVFRGSPSHQLRFEATTPDAGVALSEVVHACLSLAGTPHAGIVMSAEIAGLVCTRLRRSPARGEELKFDFPAVREWMSFVPEREFARFSCLVVGVASSKPPANLAPFVRAISDDYKGHFHAAVTAFRSLPRGKLEIGPTVMESFQPRSVLSVVHLLRDERPIEGAGESELQRGACWIFPISDRGIV